MLTAIGLPSAPVLASSSLPVDEGFPNPLQFNHVLVGIPVVGLSEARVYADAIAEGWLFFDPTAQDTKLGGVPSPLQGKLALVCDASDGRLIRLPEHSPARTYRRSYQVEASLHVDGSVSADVRVIDRGYEAAYVSTERGRIPIERQIENWKRRIYPCAPAVTISNFQYAPEPDSGWVRFRVEMPGYATGSDSLRLLKLDFLHPAKPPDLLPGDRRHPIMMGQRALTDAEIRWHLPAEWSGSVTGLSGKAACEGGCLRYRLTSLKARDLRVQWEIQLTGQTMDPSEYDSAVRFSEKMSDLHCLTVLLRKVVSGE
jgi:hypothetical protein